MGFSDCYKSLIITMKKDTILFILSEIAKEMQIADLDRQLYLLKRKNVNLKKLEDMEDENEKIALLKMKLKSDKGYNADIEVRISANQYGRIMGILHEKSPSNKKLIAAAPELLEFAKEIVKRYSNSPWIYEKANKIIKKIE